MASKLLTQFAYVRASSRK